MTVQDFITKNGLSSSRKNDDGTFIIFKPTNFTVCGHKVDAIKIMYNHDASLRHVYLYGKNMKELGNKLSRSQFSVCEMGFKYIVQSCGDDEITMYSAEPDSHVYDMEYDVQQTQRLCVGTDFIQNLMDGNNTPPEGQLFFDSSDHIRYQNGIDVSGHNYGCNRRIVIQKNTEGYEGYTVTMFNLDGIHPLWQNNIQMAPKRMTIVSSSNNVVKLRGFGSDIMSNYGIVLLIEGKTIVQVRLDMYDRGIYIRYFQ